MSKYLQKLKSGISMYGGHYIGEKYAFNTPALSKCGNGYKEGLKHRFTSKDASDISLLIDIIRRFKFKTVISEVNKSSFEFESKLESQQVFLFRICRYTRSKVIRKILEDTIMINKSGVKIQNAFLLAHYYNYKNDSFGNNVDYFSPTMDGFYDPTNKTSIKVVYLNKPFKLLKDFHLCFTDKIMTYNYLYMYSSASNLENEKKLIFKFLKENDFKAAEKYLLHVFK